MNKFAKDGMTHTTTMRSHIPKGSAIQKYRQQPMPNTIRRVERVEFNMDILENDRAPQTSETCPIHNPYCKASIRTQVICQYSMFPSKSAVYTGPKNNDHRLGAQPSIIVILNN